MKIVGMLRVKDEARWIGRVIQSMLPVCERIFVLDDHSTDFTAAICLSFPEVTLFHSPFDGLQETRDKNWLLDKVAECQPDWILHIDGDEVLAIGSCDQLRALAESGSGNDAYRLQVLYLWDRLDQVRIDGVYANLSRPSFFRFRPGARFHSADGGGFHCGNVPEPRQVADCGVKLLHYGYLHREDRIRKFEWYNAQLPVPEVEDGYKHMAIGDLFPADSRFRWGGPLELRTL